MRSVLDLCNTHVVRIYLKENKVKIKLFLLIKFKFMKIRDRYYLVNTSLINAVSMPDLGLERAIGGETFL